MTDLASRTGIPLTGSSEEPLPGSVVRDLVAWTERDIDGLQRELAEAQREAEAEEFLLAQHPAALFIAREVEGGLSTGLAGRPTPEVFTPTDPLPSTDLWVATDVPTEATPVSAIPAVPAHAEAPAPTLLWEPDHDPLASAPVGPLAPVPVPSVALPETTVALTPSPTTPPATAPRANTTPRTTVVRRPSPTGTAPVASTAAQSGTAPAPALQPPHPVTRSEILEARGGSRSGHFLAHWMMKAGVALALIGILLLKFG